MSSLAPSSTANRRAAPRRSDWVRRHPLTAFLALVFGVSWPILAIPVLQARGLLAGPRLPLPVFVLLVTFAVMLPAAVGITGLVEGGRGVAALLRRAVAWRSRPTTWLLLIVGVPSLTLLLGWAAGGTMSAPSLRVLGADLLSVLSAVLVIHLAEELVWAGFVQTRLGERHRLVVAAGLTAIPFAALHLPLSLLGEVSVRSVLADAGGLLLLGLLLRIAIGVALVQTSGSVLAAAVLHGSFNAANNGGGVVDHLLTGADHSLLAVIAVALLGVVGLVRVGRRRGDSDQ